MKPITLVKVKRDVWKELKKQKQDRESLSDVIDRMIKRGVNP
jgi:predicted CopG family antitoxin